MWTRPNDIVLRLERLWEGGSFLSSAVRGDGLFPIEMRLKAPRASDLGARFGEAGDWVGELRDASKERRGFGYRIEYKEVSNRHTGKNRLPCRAMIDSEEDFFFLLKKRKQFDLFRKLLEFTEDRCPPLLSYIERYPIQALALADDWERLTGAALWIFGLEDRSIYLRQIDLPGADTKFFERHSAVLSDLLDILLLKSPQDFPPAPRTKLARRYGFLFDPVRVFCRLPIGNGIFPDCVSDIALPSDEFARLEFAPGSIRNILVTENKINYLCLPRTENRLIIWGAGYGFEHLAAAGWLETGNIYYWGDIDTHGFAILSQFRALFPGARSFLMDKDTLIAHRPFWEREKKQNPSVPSLLTADEESLYRELLGSAMGENIRLEQEKIAFGRVADALRDI